jgi:hypothetical protein
MLITPSSFDLVKTFYFIDDFFKEIEVRKKIERPC